MVILNRKWRAIRYSYPEGRRTGNVFLGTIPDNAKDGMRGVLISGVVKDGLAESAGLR